MGLWMKHLCQAGLLIWTARGRKNPWSSAPRARGVSQWGHVNQRMLCVIRKVCASKLAYYFFLSLFYILYLYRLYGIQIGKLLILEWIFGILFNYVMKVLVYPFFKMLFIFNMQCLHKRQDKLGVAVKFFLTQVAQFRSDHLGKNVWWHCLTLESLRFDSRQQFSHPDTMKLVNV
jgi:hypothetical protein